jgi:uncharacterized protein
MIVVSDTSCLSALIQTDHIELLPQLFGEVIVPAPVFEELMALSNFGVDVSFLSTVSWLKIIHASPSVLLNNLMETLDVGEAHAIALSVELAADLLIIDERKGRLIAESLQLVFTGLGGVLLRAKAAGLIEAVAPLLSQFENKAGFRLSPKARSIILEAAGEAG